MNLKYLVEDVNQLSYKTLNYLFFLLQFERVEKRWWLWFVCLMKQCIKIKKTSDGLEPNFLVTLAHSKVGPLRMASPWKGTDYENWEPQD